MLLRGLLLLFMGQCFLGVTQVQAQSVQPPFRAIVGPVLIAHRGGALEVPENTLAGVRHAISVKADWIEIDVTLSSDDRVVVLHDSTLDRTTNGHGPVSKKRLSELQKLRAGNPGLSIKSLARLKLAGITPPDFGDAYAKEHVPSLKQVLESGDIRVMIEMKAGAHPRRLAHGVIDTINKSYAWQRVAVGSFDTELLELAHGRDPTVPLIGIAKTLQALENHLELPLSAVAVSESLLDSAFKIVPPGVAIWVWTVRDLKTAEALRDRGVHGIITDIPKKVVKHLRPPVDVHLKLSR
jgi:glycerophosphoryl diester phosphodiesterase